jgi:hypothetical protein
MHELRNCLDNKQCGSKPLRFEASWLRGPPQGSVAFSSVFTNEDGQRISIKRSYTYVQPDPAFDGTLVMVSLERTGGSDPSDAELARLTKAQVAKTRSLAG